MTSDILLSNGTAITKNKISSREEAWSFISGWKNIPIKLRLDLTNEDGSDFEYHGFEQILVEGNVDDMVGLYYHWKAVMPNLIDILNLIMTDFSTPDSCSDQNIIDDQMGNLDNLLRTMGIEEDEFDDTAELLNDLARDLYNYLTYTLYHFKLIDETKTWEFLTCKEAKINDGKLYMTVQIYVDALRDLDYMDERTDISFVEIVNEIQKLFTVSESRRRDREVYNRSRDGRLIDRLLS